MIDPGRGALLGVVAAAVTISPGQPTPVQTAELIEIPGGARETRARIGRRLVRISRPSRATIPTVPAAIERGWPDVWVTVEAWHERMTTGLRLRSDGGEWGVITEPQPHRRRFKLEPMSPPTVPVPIAGVELQDSRGPVGVVEKAEVLPVEVANVEGRRVPADVTTVWASPAADEAEVMDVVLGELIRWDPDVPLLTEVSPGYRVEVAGPDADGAVQVQVAAGAGPGLVARIGFADEIEGIWTVALMGLVNADGKALMGLVTDEPTRAGFGIFATSNPAPGRYRVRWQVSKRSVHRAS